jgi:hypothetical protein
MPVAKKLDLYKTHNDEYAAPKKPALIKVKPASYLCVTGRGAPGGEAFVTKLGALYNVAFTVKMEKKFAGQDYAVCKLEGLWWGSGRTDFYLEPPATWNWKLLIRTPDFIKKRDVDKAVRRLIDKGKDPSVRAISLERISEGQCVQALHVGPYSRENETIAAMVDFARWKGLSFHGLHHEIYLSDPRRVAPERLRTILRHPVK